MIKKFFLWITVLAFSPLGAYGAATDQPLLQSSDVTFLGSFHAPENFNHGCAAMSLSDDGTQMYCSGPWAGDVATLGRLTIPTNLSGSPTATQVQAPVNIPGTTGAPANIAIGGSMVYNNRLIVSKRVWYDSQSNGDYTHTAGTTSITGFPTGNLAQLANLGQLAQSASGYMGKIPTEWQSLLGGPAFTGNSAMSIITRCSAGPSFFVFDPDDVKVTNPIPNEPLMLFDWNLGQSLDGQDSVANDIYSRADQNNGGMAFPSGTRSVLFITTHGTGARCYGSGCTDPCFEGAPGEHAYPYRQQITAFDANDLLAVKNGTKEPYEVSPYAWWQLPNTDSTCGIMAYGGAAYDDTNHKLYVSQGPWNDVVINVYSVNIPSGGGDTTSPTVTITSPTSTGTHSTSTTPMTSFGGTSSDNTGVSSVTWSCPTCSPTSGTASGTTSWSVASIGLSSGANTITVTAHDAAGNTGTDSHVETYTPAGCRTVNVSNLSELYAAFASEQDCDEIVIAPGTYTLNTVALSVDAPNVVVRGSTGNRDDVVIQGDAMSSGSTIKVIFFFPQGAYGQNATIKDLSVGRVGWHAIMLNGDGSGNGSTFDNIHLFDAYQQLFKSTYITGGGTGSSNVTVKNCKFDYSAGHAPQYYVGGIDAHSPDGWVIQDNEFWYIHYDDLNNDLPDPAVHLWISQDHGAIQYSGSNIVERNLFVDNARDIGVWYNDGTAIVRNNMIYRSSAYADQDVSIGIENSPTTKVYNNTIYSLGSYPNAIEYRFSVTNNVLIQNNLTNLPIVARDGATGTVSNNVTNAQSNWFINPSAGNLRLASSVPTVVDQGYNVSGLSDDFDGTARTQPYDIGADEYSGASVIPRRAVGARISGGMIK